MSEPKKYRWSGPHEWLLEQAETWPADMLFSCLRDLALKCDPDTLQDIFQKEMDADGYFTPIGEEKNDGD
jgi:hypothetical protein